MDEFRSKVKEGLKLTYERFIVQATKNDEEIVIADKTGKIIRMKARDLKK